MTMYTLYRVYKSGEKHLVGYFSSPVEAGCAIDEDQHKDDAEAVYEMERDSDDAKHDDS